MCQEALEMSRISYNVLYIMVLMVSFALTLPTRGTCNTLHEYAFIFFLLCAWFQLYSSAFARDAYICGTL